MSERTSTIRAREIGCQLRRFRENVGLTQHFAAKKIAMSTASMCRIEDGSRPASAEDVAALLAVYNVTGPERETLLAIAREVDERGWWQRYDPVLTRALDTLTSLENRACTITSHETDLIPGLLQVPEYIGGLMRASGGLPESEVKTRVKTRTTRRHILVKDDPVHLAAFIGETALHRAYGSPAVLHRQLGYLLKMMERPNIIIRIVPVKGVDMPPLGSFQLLRFPVAPAVVRTFNLASDLFLEDPEEIELFDQAVHQLMRTALDTGESAGLIARLMRTLEEDPDVLPRLGRSPVAEE